MTSAKELWYLTRGSGAVALLLLTLSMCLGILTALRVRVVAQPRFVTASLHRNLTLASLVFIVLHVVTTVLDGYAPIGLKDAIIPFASPYRPIWLGLGAVAFDLMLALAITSYLRRRVGARTWRALHWLAYASWPIALMHSLGTGSDARAGWLTWLGFASLAAVAVAALMRATSGKGYGLIRGGGTVAALAVPIALIVWYSGGPAKHGWARRAGTPTHLIASARTGATVFTSASAAQPPGSFDAPVSGTIRQSRLLDGEVGVVIQLGLQGGPRGALRIDLHGVAIEDGVSMRSSGVSFVPATTRAVYLGRVTGLEGSLVAADVRDAAGHELQLTARLSLDPSAGTASGTLAATSGSGTG